MLFYDVNLYMYFVQCFEAWNNLAKCYIKSGQKSRAYYALKEAVKCNYENWMVWDNLMAVSVDCGCFEEVMINLLKFKLNYKVLTHFCFLNNSKGNQMLSQVD